MKCLGIWLQPVNRWLVAWLISKWGSAVVIVGTLALAASSAAYLTSTYDHQAHVGVSVPGGVTSVPAPPLCTPHGGF